MKRLLFLQLGISVLFGQPDTTSLGYYPLHVGDIWQYYYYRTSYFGGSTQYYFTKEIIADTLMDDSGLRYYHVRTTTPSHETNGLHRVDSLQGIVYSYRSDGPDQEIYVLSSEPGDTVLNGFIHTASNTLEVLGDSTTVKLFSHYDDGGPGYGSYSFAHSYGWLESYSSDSETTITTDLVYARIGGVEYGEFVVSTIDRSTLITPSSYEVSIYPNPFNDHLVIEVTKLDPNPISVGIYSITGQEIARLRPSLPENPSHSITWDASKMASGVYLIVLEGGDSVTTSKAILIR